MATECFERCRRVTDELHARDHATLHLFDVEVDAHDGAGKLQCTSVVVQICVGQLAADDEDRICRFDVALDATEDKGVFRAQRMRTWHHTFGVAREHDRSIEGFGDGDECGGRVLCSAAGDDDGLACRRQHLCRATDVDRRRGRWRDGDVRTQKCITR